MRRLWRSLKYELVYSGDFVSGADLFQALQRYFYFCKSSAAALGARLRHAGRSALAPIKKEEVIAIVGPRPHAPGIYRSFLQSGWFFFGTSRLYPGGQLKSIEWLQKHRKKLPQSLWGAEGVTSIKIEFRHIETSNEYAPRTPAEIEFLDNLKAVRRRSESTTATQYD